MEIKTVKQYIEDQAVKYAVERGLANVNDKMIITPHPVKEHVFKIGEATFIGNHFELMNLIGLTKEIIEEKHILIPYRYKSHWEISAYLYRVKQTQDVEGMIPLLVEDFSYFDKNVYQVFYHARCNDGTGAAVEFFDKFKARTYFTPIGYGVNPKDFIHFKDVNTVVFLDYCPSKEIVEHLILVQKVKRIFILDHHKTALKTIESYGELLDLPVIHFFIHQDMSGAMLAFKTDFNQFLNAPKTIISQSDELFTNMIFKIEEVPVCECVDKSEIEIRLFDEVDPNSGKIYHRGGGVTSLARFKFYQLLDIRDRWVLDSPELKDRADNLSAYLNTYEWNSLPIAAAAKKAEAMTQSLDTINEVGGAVNRSILNQANDAIYFSTKFELVDGTDSKVQVAYSLTTINVSTAGSVWGDINSNHPSLFIGVNIIDKRTVSLSLRSNAKYNARLVAEELVKEGICTSGGGHDQACGASMPYPEEGLNTKDLFEKINNVVIKLEASKV